MIPSKIIGKISIKRNIGYVFPENITNLEEIKINTKNLYKSMDGDLVVVRNIVKKNNKYEGKIHKILKRELDKLCGIVVIDKQKLKRCYDNQKLNEYEVYLPRQEELINVYSYNLLVKGDIITIKNYNWTNPYSEEKKNGYFDKYIGNMINDSNDTDLILHCFPNFTKKCSDQDKILKYIKKIKEPKKDKYHIDYTKLRCFTIDPDKSKDFDDAISISYDDQKDIYLLGVHIADVTHYVKNDSILDKVSKKICTSLYLKDYVVPMLHPKLSNDLCSLKPNVDRYTVSVMMLIKDGQVINYRINRSIIKSKKRFTYNEITEILNRKKKSSYFPEIKNLEKLCKIIKDHRKKNGWIEIQRNHINIVKENNKYKIINEKDTISHQMIEQSMILANHIIAKHLSTKSLDLPYRIHNSSDHSFDLLRKSIKKIEKNVPRIITSKYLNNLFKKYKNTPFYNYLFINYIRNSKAAKYTTNNLGHFLLYLSHYTHFTSPIRRYIDIIIHRILLKENKLNKKELEEICKNCNYQMKTSKNAENISSKIYKIRYLRSLKEEDRIYEGYIIDIKENALIIYIKKLDMDIFIDVDDYYKNELQLNNNYITYKNKKYKLGDKLKVKCVDADLFYLIMDWELI